METGLLEGIVARPMCGTLPKTLLFDSDGTQDATIAKQYWRFRPGLMSTLILPLNGTNYSSQK